MRTYRVGAALAVVLLGALAGCGDEESEALYAVGSTHQLCAPAAAGTHTEGFDTFANRGPGPVTVDRVEWPTEGDLEVDSIRVLQRQPGDQFATVGLWAGLPQEALRGSERQAWERAVPAEGSELGEADPDEGYLVFVVGFRGTDGSAGPLTLHYTDAEGVSGTATSFVEIRVAERCGTGG